VVAAARTTTALRLADWKAAHWRVLDDEGTSRGAGMQGVGTYFAAALDSSPQRRHRPAAGVGHRVGAPMSGATLLVCMRDRGSVRVVLGVKALQMPT
jgi:hypothetical protein